MKVECIDEWLLCAIVGGELGNVSATEEVIALMWES